MATYYHRNSEIQGGGSDGFQTLILMNPAGYVGYSDTNQQQNPGGSNFVFLNSNNPGSSLNLPHAPPNIHAQQFVGIPLSSSTTTTGGAASSPTASVHSQQDFSALHGFVPRFHYNLYNPGGGMGPSAARDTPRAQQGLSLSLSPQQTAGYGTASSFRPEREVVPTPPLVATTTVSLSNGEDQQQHHLRGSGGSSSSGISNGVNGVRSVLMSSKYLKAAQELLDEVVNVGKGVKASAEFSAKGQTTKNIGESSTAQAGAGDSQAGVKRAAELSTAEKQEIQMKKAKLINMLDEVEQRYRQYHHQMQIVISWFEQAAAIGSAKTYTALALQTISKQFRCLKDAILGQIRAASKNLGEEDSFSGKMEGSRLKFVDNQLRQQRALQQLGMIQQNAWRPQRGLPERSVSVLRAWLFEHFLHPYPKDSDKIMLAKQTGLTRSQVSNWFINARVRLWKPMVEEMYLEEMKEQQKNNASSEEEASKTDHTNEDSTSKATPSQEKSPGGLDNLNQSIFLSKQEDISNHSIAPPISMSTTTPSTPPSAIDIRNHSGFNLIVSSDMDSIGHSPKKQRSTEMLHSPTNTDNEKQSRDGFTLMGVPTNLIGGFGSYTTMGELGRFGAQQFPGSYPGNGVSLTLGLPHCENLPLSTNYQTFLPNQGMQLGRGVEIEENDFNNINTTASDHPTNMYEDISIQDRKRFAAQLLPDFVA